jgi:hypothetical protein
MNAQEIRDLFKKNGLDISQEDVWEVRPGTPVVLHKALERLAAAIGVQWEDPQVIRSERDEAVVLVRGYIKGRPAEWSIGEACIGQNYKVTGKMQPYPYAMAEKRAKDRVILKLAGLHGAYSEEEADDFKQRAEPEKPPPVRVETRPSRAVYIENALERMNDFTSASDLLAWAKTEREKVWPQYGIQPHDEDGQAFVHAYMQRKAALEENEEAA